jgi:hypothetical protein
MMASSQHNDDYAEEDNYLFAETIEEEELLQRTRKSK